MFSRLTEACVRPNRLRVNMQLVHTVIVTRHGGSNVHVLFSSPGELCFFFLRRDDAAFVVTI